MSSTKPVTGEIVVHSRTTLYDLEVGGERATYTYASATYSGDIDGPAHEAFMAIRRADGSQVHIGFGTFVGKLAGKSGALVWKFEGRPGSGEIEIVSGEGDLARTTGKARYALKPGSTTEFTYEGEAG